MRRGKGVGLRLLAWRKRGKKPRRKQTQGLVLLLTFTVLLMAALPFALYSFFHDRLTGGDQSQIIRFSDGYMIKVYREQLGIVVDVPLEDYVKGVVSGEMPASFPMEALKAQAVAARTYGVARQLALQADGGVGHHGAPVCDTTHCQVYRTPEELRQLKGDQWMRDSWHLIDEAVESTRGQLLYYHDALVEQPLFHSSSGGRTENSEDVFVAMVPYLRSVESPFEAEAPHQDEVVSMTIKSFSKKIKTGFPDLKTGSVNKSTIKILSRSKGNAVNQIRVGNLTLSGRQIRDLLGLLSTKFSISFDSDEVAFTTEGYGHGVGMSQWGASGMAKAGYDYVSILQHYYQGVVVK